MAEQQKESCGRNFLRQFRDLKTREFRTISADQFMEVWNHYDANGDGFIDGKELDSFLIELVGSITSSSDTGPEVICESAMQCAKDQILSAFDRNKDGKIDFVELAEILPTEENFLLLFRQENHLESSVEFMKIWRKFDSDNSGYIEADELKNFLRDILRKGDVECIDEERLTSYTGNVLQLFDRNKDGKLQLSEMAKLLPVKENFLCKPIFKKLRGKVKYLIGKEGSGEASGTSKLTNDDIKRVFRLYDRDDNKTIENVELDGFLKDLMELIETDYTDSDLFEFKQILLEKCDLDHNGKIDMDELTMILMSYPDSEDKTV